MNTITFLKHYIVIYLLLLLIGYFNLCFLFTSFNPIDFIYESKVFILVASFVISIFACIIITSDRTNNS